MPILSYMLVYSGCQVVNIVFQSLWQERNCKDREIYVDSFFEFLLEHFCRCHLLFIFVKVNISCYS
jgi:hypothetical protein